MEGPPLHGVHAGDYLEGRAPEYPPILDLHPRTATERRRQKQAERAYDHALMMYLRDKAIWPTLMASGFRRGEVLRIRAREDFYRHQFTGGEWVRF